MKRPITKALTTPKKKRRNAVRKTNPGSRGYRRNSEMEVLLRGRDIEPPGAYQQTQVHQAFKSVVNDIVNDLVPGVDQARKDLRDLEKKIANQPETIWHRLQFSMDTLRKDINDRLPRIEKQYDDMVALVGRMDRLEKALQQLRTELQELQEHSLRVTPGLSNWKEGSNAP